MDQPQPFREPWDEGPDEQHATDLARNAARNCRWLGTLATILFGLLCFAIWSYPGMSEADRAEVSGGIEGMFTNAVLENLLLILLLLGLAPSLTLLVLTHFIGQNHPWAVRIGFGLAAMLTALLGLMVLTGVAGALGQGQILAMLVGLIFYGLPAAMGVRAVRATWQLMQAQRSL